MSLSRRIQLHERLEAAKPKPLPPPPPMGYELYPVPGEHLDPRGPSFCRICGWIVVDYETQLCSKHFGRALKVRQCSPAVLPESSPRP